MTNLFSSTSKNCWFSLDAVSRENNDFASSEEEEGGGPDQGGRMARGGKGVEGALHHFQQSSPPNSTSTKTAPSYTQEYVGGNNVEQAVSSRPLAVSKGKKSSGANNNSLSSYKDGEEGKKESHSRLLRSASTSTPHSEDSQGIPSHPRRRSAHQVNQVPTVSKAGKKSLKTNSNAHPDDILLLQTGKTNSEEDLPESDKDWEEQEDGEEVKVDIPGGEVIGKIKHRTEYRTDILKQRRNNTINMKNTSKIKGCDFCGKLTPLQGKKGKNFKKYIQDLPATTNPSGSPIVSLCDSCTLTFSSSRRKDGSLLGGMEGDEGEDGKVSKIQQDCSSSGCEKRVFSYQDAPSYLKFNPYITGGYRTMLTPRQCVKSLFWWTNETLNIWSHLLGWLFFLALSIYDSVGLLNQATTHPWDRVIMALLLVSFQACMLLSALYHVFCCCSERFYRRWLSADLFGVSLSLLAIYISGIYYAFSCVPFWLNFYLITVGAIFVSAMVLQIIPVVNKPTTAKAFHGRLVVFGGWAAYGIVPTLHWALLHGGMSSPVVALLLPRIFWMYGISVTAFFFYVLRVPEKLFPGLVNFIGSSHQIWHVLIVAALYHWHNTGLLYLQFRSTNSCTDEYNFLFPSVKDEQLVQVN